MHFIHDFSEFAIKKIYNIILMKEIEGVFIGFCPRAFVWIALVETFIACIRMNSIAENIYCVHSYE